ncbi:hypothetical protein ACQVPI_22055 [Bacillus wiedmannii]|uniref:hypothetical protein n=1 Tax=Bacillus wiedmannii TaxID=1890302 RepID=UPI003D65B5E9
MSYLFFKASRNATGQITDLFDFMWPTIAGVWNLREQVKNHLSIEPSATDKDLREKFISGSEINNVNFRKAFVKRTWEEQEQKLAEFLLTNIFAIHENWLDEVYYAMYPQHINTDIDISWFTKGMQFPFGSNSSNKHVWRAIRRACSNESIMLKDAFYSSLCANKKNSKQNLNNLLICYRFFKECRNTIIHNAGKVKIGSNLINAYNRFLTVSNTNSLDVKEVPEHLPVVVGTDLKISLRGVVGFCEVVLRIITTCDAELARSLDAENEFEKAWKQSKQKNRTLKKESAKREKQIKRYLIKLQYPEPSSIDRIEDFIVNQKNLVFQSI